MSEFREPVFLFAQLRVTPDSLDRLPAFVGCAFIRCAFTELFHELNQRFTRRSGIGRSISEVYILALVHYIELHHHA